MLNGLEKTLETKIPEAERRWLIAESPADYSVDTDFHHTGWPSDPET